MILFQIILSTFSITLCVFVAVAFLYANKNWLPKILMSLVSLSAGALMGGAFIHLLPESLPNIGADAVGLLVLASFLFFLIMEKFLHWRHCHKDSCPVHSFGRINLLGDSLHNFIDGLVIAASFIVDTNTGIAATLALALHEIPQEIGDFGVLLYAGYEKKKALFYNYLVATTVIIGGVFGYYFNHLIGGFMPYILPFAAGGFIYIGASDLIPEIRKEENIKRSFFNIFIFLVGVIFMYFIKFAHE